jgi:2-methylfumaryl-CoA isomerase
MVVAISLRQWQLLAQATEIEPHLPAMASALRLDFCREGDRFRGRDTLAALIAPWVAKRTLAEVAKVLDDLGVCWGPYQTFTQLVEEDWRCSEANPMFKDIARPGVGTSRTPGTPVAFKASPRLIPRPAPLLGRHTDEILAKALGLSAVARRPARRRHWRRAGA